MNNQTMLAQGKGGIVLRLVSVFQSRFSCQFGGRSFSLSLPNQT